MNIVFAQTNGQVYTQDVSGVYTMNNGLGDNFVQRIYIDCNCPIRTRVIIQWFQPQDRKTKHIRPKRAEQRTKNVLLSYFL